MSLPRDDKVEITPTSESSPQPHELLTAPQTRRSSTTSTKIDPKEDVDKSTESRPGVDMSYILRGKKLAFTFTSMLLSLFLVALDQTILATALPRIASDFDAFYLQGWVSSAFILTQTAFIPIFGQVLRIYPAKWCLLSGIAIFELGSIVCGAGPNVYAIIVGRAISGVGAAEIFISMLSILAQVTLLEDRPKLFGAFGAVFGISSIIGPLIGGALTDSSEYGWHYVFWLNVPIGFLSALGSCFLLKAAPPLGSDPTKRSTRDILRQTLQMDWIGGILILGAVTALVYALQTGGNTKPWSDGGVIACFVVAGVLAVVMVFWQRRLGDRALIPPAIFKSLSIYAILVTTFMTRCSMLLLTYYLPIYYQAAKNHSATKSGIDIIALMLSTVVFVILSGRLVGKFGRYWPWLVLGPIPGAIGAGLMYTISPTTSGAKVIGYQILCGVGLGTTLQQGLFAMQASFRATPRMVAQATGVASFAQFLGGTISLSIGQSALSTELTKNFEKYAPSAPLSLIKESPLKIWDLEPSLIPGAVQAYVKSLDITFVITVAFFAMGSISAFFVENIDIRPPKKEEVQKDEEKADSSNVEAAKENKAEAVAEGEVARAEGV